MLFLVVVLGAQQTAGKGVVKVPAAGRKIWIAVRKVKGAVGTGFGDIKIDTKNLDLGTTYLVKIKLFMDNLTLKYPR